MNKIEKWRIGRTSVAGVLFLASVGICAQTPGAPGLFVSGPDALSLQSETRFVVEAAPCPGEWRDHFDLVSKGGQITVPVIDTLGASPCETKRTVISVPPAALAPFAIGEEVLLRGEVGPWRYEGTFNVVTATPETGGWLLNVPSTAVIYSSRDTQISFRTVNPKGKPFPTKLILKFRNLKGKVLTKWKYPIVALPGESAHIVTVPLSVALKAKLRGANSLKTDLVKDGDQKASGQSLIDWDFLVAVAADHVSGAHPLAVSFNSLASGGTPPYQFDWTLGDGSAHQLMQNPTHTYANAGVFSASVSVLDALGGAIISDPIAIVVQ